MSVDFSISGWWIIYYLLMGVILWLPLNYLAIGVTNRKRHTLWKTLGTWFKRNGFWGSLWKIVLQVVLWPVAAIEAWPL